MNQKNEIINRIGEKRYAHTLRVVEVAKKLAHIYNIDVKKAEIAAFYHDCAKIKDTEKLLRQCEKYGLKITEDMNKAPQIIHGYLGAIIAEKDYGINDQDVLNAIRYHTTGRKNMSKLEKIIYLADYIEPNRNFEGIEEARTLAYEDLDKAMYFSLNNSIVFLCNSNSYIVPDTILARNYILEA